MVGIVVSFWGPAYFQGAKLLLVSERVYHLQLQIAPSQDTPGVVSLLRNTHASPGISEVRTWDSNGGSRDNEVYP